MAVFTRISENDIISLLNGYDIGTLQKAEGIAEGVENTNYRLDTTSGRYILTIYEKRVNPADLPFFMELQARLQKGGFPCPAPVTAKNSNIINKIGDKHYTIVSFLSGKWNRNTTTTRVEKAAATLAAMHNITAGFDNLSRENSLGRDFWISAYGKVKGQAEEKYSGLKELAEAGFSLTANMPADLPKGIIHADYFPDNVLFDKEEVSGVIDFYMACHESYAYDIGIMINAWCFESDRSFNKEKCAALISAYNKVRKITPEEAKNMRLMCIAGSLRFLASRAHDLFLHDGNALVTPHDPYDYVCRLKFHLEHGGIDAYGLI